jgi:hypothetical protein
MAGLVPAIHAFLFVAVKDVDARHKAGHDGDRLSSHARLFLIFAVRALAAIMREPGMTAEPCQCQYGG